MDIMDKLDLSPLERAVQRLDEGLSRYQQDISDIQIRDGLIQRFEFTYEISHKMLKRFLEMASPSPEQFEGMAFADLIRSGNEYGVLLGNWEDWKEYRERRGNARDSWDDEMAVDVAQSIPVFLKEARYFLNKLKSKMENELCQD